MHTGDEVSTGEKRARGASVTRAEGIAISALALNVATLIFGLGVMWGDIQDNTRRIAEQERKMDGLIPKVERIDANVAYLAERAKEEREARR